MVPGDFGTVQGWTVQARNETTMMASWVQIDSNSDFSLRNLPYGVFSTVTSKPKIGVAIGDYVLDMGLLAQEGLFADLDFDTSTLKDSTLNGYAALGRKVHGAVRQKLQDILKEDTPLGSVLRDNKDLRTKALVPLRDVQMHLPMTIGDYTDYFVGYHHAVNCASIIKPGQTIEEICPGFFNIPIAYHGRASSVVVSSTPFRRPKGIFPVDGKLISGPCQRLDFEVEFAAFIGRGDKMGSSIDVNEAEDHIFGFVLMKDWSARDIQMYEASLLGPFNGKNFCTTVSPWVVPPEALEPFRMAPKQPRPLADYLTESHKESGYNIPIEAVITHDSRRYKAATCNTNNVVFSMGQMIAHHTRGGCPLQTGDLIATGTLSGPTREELGCLLEITRGSEPYDMPATEGSGGTLRRIFLEDGDTVEYSAEVRSEDGLGNVGFGLCSGQVLAAR